MRPFLQLLLLLVAMLSPIAAFSQPDFEATKALAEAGDAEAQLNLGEMYAKGEGVERDFQAALRWLTLAAEHGNAIAQYELGRAYADESSTVVAQNHQEAVKWYRLAAEQGFAPAQTSLGDMYETGEGVAQSYQEAFKWFRLAAEQGDFRAQLNLGSMYFYGRGVVQSYSRAYVWYSVSAAQNNIGAEARDSLLNLLSPQALEQAQAQATRCFESGFKDCD